MCLCVRLHLTSDHSEEGSIKKRIRAPINTHQSSADQIFIQEERGEQTPCLSAFLSVSPLVGNFLLQVCLQKPDLSVFVYRSQAL